MKKYITLILFFSMMITANTLFAEKYNLNMATDSSLLITGAALNISGYTMQYFGKPATTDDIQRAQQNQNFLFIDKLVIDNWSPTAAKTSDIFIGTIMATPLLFFALPDTRNNFGKIMLMYAETMMICNGLNITTKNIVKRYRPYVYNNQVPIDNKLTYDTRLSFYSGHTTNAFASATFFTMILLNYYTNIPAGIGVATIYTMAATIAILRLVAGKHFPTDVLTGALIGSASAILVIKLHEGSEKDESAVEPRIGSQNLGLSFRMNF